jgi:hypothetical protein
VTSSLKSSGIFPSLDSSMALHHTEPTLVVVTHGLSAFAADIRTIRAARQAKQSDFSPAH